MSYSGFEWGDYVSVAQQRRRAQRKIAELKKEGRPIAPVTIDGRKIARTFWGQSWCNNLERYSDFATRLPRGRSYVRNGLVVDLQIDRGKVSAMVSGSDLYQISITVVPAAKERWNAICRDSAGTIDSLVELLQGRLAKGVMDRVCREGDGLFPTPDEIEFSCSCPDWADMCKHVAASLYGVGARLDENPQLLFALRGVDENDMLADTGQDLARSKSALKAESVLGDSDVAALFGLEMVEPISGPVLTAPKPSRRSKAKEANATKKAAKADGGPRGARRKGGSKRKAAALAKEERARKHTKHST